MKIREEAPVTTKNTSSSLRAFGIVSWIFGLAFFVIGVLNLLLVHAVPGIFYLLLSFLYFPWVNNLLKKRLNLSIPPFIKIILGLVILWATLAVGDLAEILGL